MPALHRDHASLPQPSSKAALAVEAKHQDLMAKWRDNQARVHELQSKALDSLPDSVAQEVGLGDEARRSVAAYLQDRATLFRFLRRARFSVDSALTLLSTTLIWRLKTDLDSLSLDSLHPLYVSPPKPRPPLFWSNTRLCDRYGRPCGVISLRSLERPTEGGLEAAKEYIVACMESTRRLLADRLAQHEAAAGHSGDDDGGGKAAAHTGPQAPLQMVVALSLQSSGMANLELELLPFLLDLLKNHFPGMVGAVFILNYGWVHAGMWGLAKRVLPEQALARIFFPTDAELCSEHFSPEAVPRSLGGAWSVEVDDASNDVMRRYARPTWLEGLGIGSAPSSPTAEEPPERHWPSGRTPLSRTGSFESALDEYFSVENTPWASRRASAAGTPRGDLTPQAFFSSGASSPVVHTLRMTPRAERTLQHLQMTRGAGNSAGAGSAPNNLHLGGSKPEPERTARRDATTNQDQEGEASQEPGAGLRINVTGLPLGVTGLTPLANPPQYSPTYRRRRGLSASSKSGGGGRSVHFGTSPSMSRRASPVRRVGSFRDFRLLASDVHEDAFPFSGNGAGDDESDGGSSGTTKVDEAAFKGRDAPGTDKSRDGAEARLGADGGDTQRNLGHEPLLADGARSAAGAATGPDSSDRLSHPPASPRLQSADAEHPPPTARDASASSSSVQLLLSRRTRKYNDVPGAVSPYNADNPFYGYPAFSVTPAAPSSSSRAAAAAAAAAAGASSSGARGVEFGGRGGGGGVGCGATQRHLRARRRKRDLLRTLSYLFVLRLLSLHRALRSSLMQLWRGACDALASRGDEGGEAARLGGEEGRRWKEAEARYGRLRRLSQLQGADGASAAVAAAQQQRRRREQQQRRAEEERRRRLEGQPLARLGVRKRYVGLAVALALLARRDARSATAELAWRLVEAMRSAPAYDAGKSAVVRGPLARFATAGAAAAAGTGAARSSDEAAVATLTGLHLRERLRPLVAQSGVGAAKPAAR